MLGLEKWQWECFTGGLDSNHHLSLDFPLTNHVYTSGVAPLTAWEHRMPTPCQRKYPRARVTVSEAAAVTKLLDNNVNLPTAPTNSCYNFISYIKYLVQQTWDSTAASECWALITQRCSTITQENGDLNELLRRPKNSQETSMDYSSP